jgi:hypothetical protein
VTCVCSILLLFASSASGQYWSIDYIFYSKPRIGDVGVGMGMSPTKCLGVYPR